MNDSFTVKMSGKWNFSLDTFLTHFMVSGIIMIEQWNWSSLGTWVIQNIDVLADFAPAFIPVDMEISVNLKSCSQQTFDNILIPIKYNNIIKY